MNQVQLTAINPEDSSVVPVACNASGMIKVEPPLVVDGPEGPEGPRGPEGPKGDDGKDGDSFVPDPAGTSAGDVLTSDGNSAYWATPRSFSYWSLTMKCDATSHVDNAYDWYKAFNGSDTNYQKIYGDSGAQFKYFYMFWPVPMVIRKFELKILGAESAAVPSVQIGGKIDGSPVKDGDWCHYQRFVSEDVGPPSYAQFQMTASFHKLVGVRINDVLLKDGNSFSQFSEFSMEHSIRTNAAKWKALLEGQEA